MDVVEPPTQVAVTRDGGKDSGKREAFQHADQGNSQQEQPQPGNRQDRESDALDGGWNLLGRFSYGDTTRARVELSDRANGRLYAADGTPLSEGFVVNRFRRMTGLMIFRISFQAACASGS